MGARRDRRNQGLAARIDRIAEIPMLLLGIAYIIAFVVESSPSSSAATRGIAEAVGYFIVALFAAELVVKTAVAERRLAYLRAHWLDVIIVLIPFLRPFRVLRLLRFLPFLIRCTVGLRRVLGPYRGAYVATTGLLSVLIGAVLMTAFEKDAGGSIRDFDDALWWAAATITTVGYGDVSPVTPEGRAVAVALMAIGIALFGMLTAGIAAYFVEGSGREEEGVTTKALMVKLEALEARLEWQDQILQAIARDRGGDGEANIQAPAASPASPASP
jgi:voltage-gated potassium channel